MSERGGRRAVGKLSRVAPAWWLVLRVCSSGLESLFLTPSQTMVWLVSMPCSLPTWHTVERNALASPLPHRRILDMGSPELWQIDGVCWDFKKKKNLWKVSSSTIELELKISLLHSTLTLLAKYRETFPPSTQLWLLASLLLFAEYE